MVHKRIYRGSSAVVHPNKNKRIPDERIEQNPAAPGFNLFDFLLNYKTGLEIRDFIDETRMPLSNEDADIILSTLSNHRSAVKAGTGSSPCPCAGCAGARTNNPHVSQSLVVPQSAMAMSANSSNVDPTLHKKPVPNGFIRNSKNMVEATKNIHGITHNHDNPSTVGAMRYPPQGYLENQSGQPNSLLRRDSLPLPNSRNADGTTAASLKRAMFASGQYTPSPPATFMNMNVHRMGNHGTPQASSTRAAVNTNVPHKRLRTQDPSFVKNHGASSSAPDTFKIGFHGKPKPHAIRTAVNTDEHLKRLRLSQEPLIVSPSVGQAHAPTVSPTFTNVNGRPRLIKTEMNTEEHLRLLRMQDIRMGSHGVTSGHPTSTNVQGKPRNIKVEQGHAEDHLRLLPFQGPFAGNHNGTPAAPSALTTLTHFHGKRPRFIKIEPGTYAGEQLQRLPEAPMEDHNVPDSTQPSTSPKTEEPLVADEVNLWSQRCNICNKSFPTSLDLQQHLIKVHIVHPNNKNDGFLSRQCKHSCKHCRKNFSDYKTFLVHKSLKNKLQCHLCTTLFFCDSSLMHHYLTTHLANSPVQKPVCEVCQRSICSKSGLAAHYMTHLLEKLFACQMCDRNFKTSLGLKNHFGTSHGIK